MSTHVKPSSIDMAIHEGVAKTKLKHFQEIVNANQNIEAIGPTPPSPVAFAEAIIYVKVSNNDRGFKLPSGTYAHFEGTAWDLGFCAGLTWMTAVFAVPESSIFGDVSFHFNSTPGVTNLNFWRGSTFIGSAVGAGLGPGMGASGGSGKFTQG